ncbi:MAG: protein kinase [Xanthomonadaceae bacterium]|nr:protein kinase [Xanthomonadaceae bacterium]
MVSETSASSAGTSGGDGGPDGWIEQYQIGELLGEGGFGQVFAGWDTRLQRGVALKFLGRVGTEEENDRLLHEARLAASARHPALVSVYDLVFCDDAVVIVMERVNGRTLKQRLAEGRVPVAEVLSILVQAADALAALHRQGMAHGDLKPSNLMLERDGQLRVLDFGLATRLDSTALPTTASPIAARAEKVVGTPAYMAPERLHGAPCSAAADIYALGMVGQWLLLSGHGLNLADVGSRTVVLPEESAQAASELAQGQRLWALLQAMTEADMARRIGSVDVIVGELARLVAPEATAPARGQSGTARFADWRRRFTVGLAVVLVSAVAFGIAVRDVDWPMEQATSGESGEHAMALYSVTESVARAEALVRDFDRSGAIVEAIELLGALSPDDQNRAPVAALLAIAYCLRYANDERDPLWLTQAESHAAQAMRADDQFALALAARGWVSEFRGDAESAEQSYRSALALEPDSTLALLGYSRLLTARGRYAESARTLAAALDSQPNERLFWDMLGTLHYRQADYPAAQNAFRRSIELKPDSVYAYANLNAVLMRMGREDEALSVIQQGLKIRPHSQLYNNLGTALYARGQFSESAAAFEAALSDARGSPNDYLKWANLGDALRWVTGRESEAHAAYSRSLQLLKPLLRPEQPDSTRYGRAALYAARLGNDEKALEYLAKAREVAHDSADFWFRAVLTSEAIGDRDRSLEYLSAALERGYPVHLVENDPDMVSLRRDLRYHFIINRSEK